MKCNDDGHEYELANFESEDHQLLLFIKKHVDRGGKNLSITIQEGTTSEEVLEMLIHRSRLLQAKLPSRQTALAITKMEEALHWLNDRTKDRKARDVEGTNLP